MNGLIRAFVAGAFGSLTTNAAHEVLRRGPDDAPRIDLLGMQAVARSLAALGAAPLTGRALYTTTLVADLLSNAAYYSFVGLASRDRAVPMGTVLGLAAGLGAVLLPPRLRLAAQPTNRTLFTRVATVALYTLGGIATGFSQRRLTAQAASLDDACWYLNKHVVITGGSRGLGFALAKLMLAAGARVTICGRSSRTLEEAAQKLSSAGGALTTVVADVRLRGDCERFIETSVKANGPIDVLINNAGVIEVGPALAQSLDDYHEAMDTHFWGPLYTTLAVLPAMRARRFGHIANVASVGGVVGVPHLTPYCASKFAQIGLTQALGAEFASDGIVMTSIVPGLMITGSPDHAIFKGRNRAEYAWFTLSDSNPFIAVSVTSAARRIMRAIRRGESHAAIGMTATMAKTMNAIWPQTTASLLKIAARLLPGPGNGSGRHSGAESHSRWTENPLTALNKKAAKSNNEVAESNAVGFDE